MSENEKRLTGRIVNKHDVEANWLKATNFVPLLGELIVYDADENCDHERIKIGDGKTNVNNLPFYKHQQVMMSETPPEDTNILWVDTTDTAPDFEQITVDTSLSQSGQAADAKITGEKIDGIVNEVEILSEDVDTLSSNLSALTGEVSSLYKVFIGKTIPVNPGNGAIWIDTNE